MRLLTTDGDRISRASTGWKTRPIQHLAVFTEELGLSVAEQEQVLGATARRLFFN